VYDAVVSGIDSVLVRFRLNLRTYSSKTLSSQSR